MTGRGSPPGLLIRRWCASDSIDALTDLLHRAYAQLGAMGLNYTAVNQTLEVTADRIRDGVCFIAIQGEQIVGTVLVKPTHARSECEFFMRTGVASLHQFGVDPALQGTGIGAALMDRAEGWAAAEGYAELALDTAEPATHLVGKYARRGYRPVGWVQWPGKVYRSVVMSKLVLADAAASSR